MKIILASQSPRRKDLLSLLVDDFQIVPSNLNEDAFIKLARTPEELVVKLAIAKAKDIGERLKKENSEPENKGIIIIAADTIVVLDADARWYVLGKPRDLKEAEVMLKKLCGRTHKVYTGMCVLSNNTGKYSVTDFSVSNVTFKSVSDRKIEEYVKKYKPLDKAGGYAIQELGESFVEETDGSITGIIGLPVPKLAQILTSLNVRIRPDWKERVKKETNSKEKI
jgi:septum formation protein